ncbi:MAG: cytochrome c biogenesis protein CcsA [Saprospiraceae bacterium]|nr:cytochrome c biogenesis protein CcsA [Saprospiraceae bacterium]
MMNILNKFITKLFSTSASGLYFILFAAAIGVATFIENDFGTAAAQKVIYRSNWFEILLILFGISIIANIIRFRMIQQKKWAILTFHVAAIVILLGAAATRYLGSEGMMHIREGDETNLILSNDTYLQFEIKEGDQTYRIEEPVFFASLGKNKFNKSYQIGNDVIEVKLNEFIPNPVEQLTSGQNGQSIIKVVIAGSGGREEHLIKKGDKVKLNGIKFNFTNTNNSDAINIFYQNDSLLFETDQPLSQMQMATQRRDTLPAGIMHPLLMRSLYSTSNGENFVITDFNNNAETLVSSASQKMGSGSIALVDLQITSKSGEGNLKIKGNSGMTGKPETLILGNTAVSVSYGARYVALPFYIRLHDFIMERYPGTNSASSYASEVTLIDKRNNLEKDHRIFMNNILNYDGYRFFQSSFDRDELGTVLSVNHDALGTWISYLGYFLLTVGMVLTLFSGNSRFSKLSKRLQEMRLSKNSVTTALMLLWFVSNTAAIKAQNIYIDPGATINKEHAEEFAHVIVQDHNGRMKPFDTQASEIMRKVARKESLYGQTADQIFLGMMVYPEYWAEIPLIKTSREESIQKLIPSEGKLVAYNDFFKPDYILKDVVKEAYNMEPKYRGAFEKEIIKIDERVNICNLVFTGRLMRIFPTEDPNSDTWLSPGEMNHMGQFNTGNGFAVNYFPDYERAVKASQETNNWQLADQMITELDNYQKTHGHSILPSENKIKFEILLNKMNVFSQLTKYYALIGLAILIMFFTLVFNPKIGYKWPLRIAFSAMAICFSFHLIGLAMRWYVSGRAPWSNGYESMIYIAFTTVLAGLIFSRKSLGGLAATAILASTILMVAGLSWLDPEITPLVPVLKSYWLTIHVSLEAGSYGFLMLAAIIGIINLILMILVTRRNKDRIKRVVQEMSIISELTMIGGLFMISIGTYLGGVWANESWGRYWGWDAKETWALVTILVYAFILHMRFIPGLRGVYAFNVASLFGLASVMMTYFGVNYYLSGLHSYAAGDPAPIPPFVYYTVAILSTISIGALLKNKQTNLFT